MNEHEYAIKNAKDIQRLEDVCTAQSVFNELYAKRHNCLLGLTGILMAGVFLLGCAYDSLKKRVETVEGKFVED